MDLTELLVEHLNAISRATPRQRSHAVGPHAYASEAGGCSRQIGLRILNAPGEEFTPSSTVNMAIGAWLHERVQDSLANYLRSYWQGQGVRLGSVNAPRVEDFYRFEIPWAIAGLSGRADGLYIHPDLWNDGQVAPDSTEQVAVLEIKSMNSNAFSSALTYGPQRGHLLQASLSALVLGASFIQMHYVSKLPKRDEAPGADWLLPADLTSAAVERDRLVEIVELTSENLVPACTYEGRAISPETQRGPPCSWCPFRAICLSMGPGVQEPPSPQAMREIQEEALARE